MIKQFQELAHDNTSGATELIQRLLGVCEAGIMAGSYHDILEGIDSLKMEQQGMPSFHAVLHTLRRDLFPLLTTGADPTRSLAYIASLQQVLEESVTAVAQHFLSLFPSPKKVLTMSRSRTVISSLFHMAEMGKITHCAVLESRPMQEGVITIRDLSERRIPATLLVDAAMGDAASEADFVVVGADGVSADGFLLNKTGTFALALVCAQLAKPLYVLCDSLKFSPQLRAEIMVEEKPAEEVVKRKKNDLFMVSNRYFDWTPIDLVTAFITERGTFTPDMITQLTGA